MADQVYFNGDFWQALAATQAGQSPTSSPASWARIKVPKLWRLALSRLTYAHLLELDGQKDKARMEEADAMGLVDELVRRGANAEVGQSRPNVQTRSVTFYTR